SVRASLLFRRGRGSRPLHGEGLASRTNVLVSEGKLRTYLCDVYAARKLGRRATGSAAGGLRGSPPGRGATARAARGIGGRPHVGVSNLILRAGRTPVADLEKIDRGLYVTDLMGFGVYAVTGAYSQGAGGFWIERGERAFPVTEITVSANFDALWKGIEAVGDDLDTRSSLTRATVGES